MPNNKSRKIIDDTGGCYFLGMSSIASFTLFTGDCHENQKYNNQELSQLCC